MELSRREFIYAAGLSSLGIATASMGVSCTGSRCVAEKANSVDYLDTLDNDLQKIIYYGSLAPSSHNSQPWKIKQVSHNQLRIFVDTNRLLSTIDPYHHETILSIGAFLENLVIAGKYFSYDLSYCVENDGEINSIYIDAFLNKVENSKDLPIGLLKRRSLRKEHLSKNISEKLLDNIVQDKKVKIFPKNSQQSKIIEDLTISATINQVKNRKIMEELSNWIRWDSDEIEKWQDGLNPETMEINGLAGLWVRMFYDKSSVLTESFSESTIDTTKEQLSSYGGWLLISSSDNSYSELLKAGRSMEAMFIRAAENKLGFHIMLQLLQEEETKNKLIKTLQLKEEPQVLIRLSHIENYPEPVSPRIVLNKIII